MDLRPSDEQQQLRDALRRLFDRRMSDLVDALPEPPAHDVARDLDDALALGLPGLGLPDDVGGAGTFADLTVAHEELGRGLAGSLLPALAAASRLLLHGDGDCRIPLLTGLIEGNRTATVAVDGADGTYRHVVAGPSVTHVLVVGANSIVRLFATGAAGMRWAEEQSGCDLASWTLHIGDAAPTAAQLQIDSAGLAAFRSEIAVLAAARQAGGARAVLDRTIEHVKTREQFDRAIGTFQAVQHQLADVATDLDGTELAVAQAAWAIDAALPLDEIRRLTAIAAISAAEVFRGATLVAHQLHGGMGFVLDSPLHLWSARAIADPTVRATRRQLLDDLADASGVTADGVTAPPDHRVTA